MGNKYYQLYKFTIVQHLVFLIFFIDVCLFWNDVLDFRLPLDVATANSLLLIGVDPTRVQRSGPLQKLYCNGHTVLDPRNGGRRRIEERKGWGGKI